jgi:hypothetical protein
VLKAGMQVTNNNTAVGEKCTGEEKRKMEVSGWFNFPLSILPFLISFPFTAQGQIGTVSNTNGVGVFTGMFLLKIKIINYLECFSL